MDNIVIGYTYSINKFFVIIIGTLENFIVFDFTFINLSQLIYSAPQRNMNILEWQMLSSIQMQDLYRNEYCYYSDYREILLQEKNINHILSPSKWYLIYEFMQSIKC